MQVKNQYYPNGTDTGNPEITIDLKRSDVNRIKKWSPEKSSEVIRFLERVEKTFLIFKKEIIDSLPPTIKSKEQ